MSEQSLEMLEKEIYGLAISAGACDLGVADLSQPKARALVEAQGGPRLSRFPRAVSFAMRLQDALVDDLPEGHREPVTARLYDAHIYKTVNGSLDQIGLEIARLLQDEGIRRCPSPRRSTSTATSSWDRCPTSWPRDLRGSAGSGRAPFWSRATSVRGCGWERCSPMRFLPRENPRGTTAGAARNA